eukprot:m.363288 g.363288  ORF g.363288 m.363288 type:complete len:607 (-) comp20798_c0_seq9:408-2228(-)
MARTFLPLYIVVAIVTCEGSGYESIDSTQAVIEESKTHHAEFAQDDFLAKSARKPKIWRIHKKNENRVPLQMDTWSADENAKMLVTENGFDVANIEVLPPDATSEVFRQRFVFQNRPVLLLNATANWTAHDTWSSPQKFVDHFGERIRGVRWPLGANLVGLVERYTTIADFVTSEMHADDGGLLFDNLFGKGSGGVSDGDNALASVPVQLQGLNLDEMHLSVGASRQGLPFHNHAAAWQTVVAGGAKLFLLFPPISSHPGHGQSVDFGPTTTDNDLEAVLTQLMVPSPLHQLQGLLTTLLTAHPQLRSKLKFAVVTRGNVIYIPCNWYHLTFNIGDVVAIGGQTGDAHVHSQQCPEDRFGRASVLFRSKEVQHACELNPLHYECVPRLAGMLLPQADYSRAAAVYRRGMRKFGRWVESGYLAPQPAAAIFYYFAASISQNMDFFKSNKGREVHTDLTYAASALDVDDKNIPIEVMAASVHHSHTNTLEDIDAATRHLSTVMAVARTLLLRRNASLSDQELEVFCRGRCDKNHKVLTVRQRLEAWAKNIRDPMDDVDESRYYWFTAGLRPQPNGGTVQNWMHLTSIQRAVQPRMRKLQEQLRRRDEL